MKRIDVLVVLSVLIVVGCSKPQATVYSGEGGKVTTDGQGNTTVIDEKGNKIDMKAGEDGWSTKSSDGSEIKVDSSGMTAKDAKGGTYSVGSSDVSEAELGLPFYPGSAPLAGRDMKADAGGKKTFVSARSTSDTVDKVVAFYRDKIKEPTSTSTPEMSAVGGKLEDGRQVAVMAIKKEGKVEIQVSVSNP